MAHHLVVHRYHMYVYWKLIPIHWDTTNDLASMEHFLDLGAPFVQSNSYSWVQMSSDFAAKLYCFWSNWYTETVFVSYQSISNKENLRPIPPATWRVTKTLFTALYKFSYIECDILPRFIFEIQISRVFHVYSKNAIFVTCGGYNQKCISIANIAMQPFFILL